MAVAVAPALTPQIGPWPSQPHVTIVPADETRPSWLTRGWLQLVDAGPIVIPLVILTVISWVTVGLSPWLVGHPLLLVTLNARLVFLLIAAPQVALLEFLVLVTLRLCIADPFNYALGRKYGPRMRQRALESRFGRMMLKVTKAERGACTLGVLLRPSAVVLAWAGSLGMSKWAVGVVDVASTMFYVYAIHQGIGLFA